MSDKKLLHSELWYLVAAVLSVICTGSLGYMLIEGWSLFDSVYMTIITLSTVGYTEIHPLTPSGRTFTMVLIIGGVGVVGYVLSKMVSDLFEQQLNSTRRHTRMLEKMRTLRGHSIFCGFGRLAQVAVRELLNHEQDVVIIDLSEVRIAEAKQLGAYTLHADATNDDVLQQAGAEHARQIVSLLPTDADNLYAILAAKEFNENLQAITRAEFPAGEKRLRQAGANRVISPYTIGGQRLADSLLRPHVLNFLDLTASGSDSELVIEELRIPDNSDLIGKTLGQTRLREHEGIIIAALITQDGKTIFNPSEHERIEQDAVLISLGETSHLKTFERYIIGGS
ncbi:potassium channel protein [bacterium]|nr:potassium channel protein [bacterium]